MDDFSRKCKSIDMVSRQGKPILITGDNRDELRACARKGIPSRDIGEATPAEKIQILDEIEKGSEIVATAEDPDELDRALKSRFYHFDS